MKDNRLIYLSAVELSSRIHAREITAEQLMSAFLAQIRKHNPRINAITDLRGEDDLLREAREKDQMLRDGTDLGPLHGLPMTVKDGFRVKGLKSSNGHPFFRNYVATDDAGLVTRLKAAGAIIMGKTNLPLLSIDWQTTNFWFGRTNNPYDIGRVPGGSSGGSAAALAMGFTPLELGSDAGGSIRVPAHFCGVCGIRTTEEALSNQGNFKFPGKPQGHRFVTVAGPMARNVGDLLLAMRVLWKDAGERPADRASVDFESSSYDGGKLNVAYSPTLYGLEIDREYEELIQQFLDRIRGFGHEVSEDRPDYDADAAYELNGTFLGMEADACAPTPSFLTKIFFYFFILLKYRDRAWAAATGRGIGISPRNRTLVMAKKKHIAAGFEEFLSRYDIWITPVSSIAAFQHQPAGRPFRVNGKKVGYTDAMGRFNFDTALGGHPVVVIPIGMTKQNLPVGISLHGKQWSDKRLLEIAVHLETLTKGFVIPEQPAAP